MSRTAPLSSLWGWTRFPRSSARSAPERPSCRGPIFINDAVMPWGKETMLLDRLRKDAMVEQDRED